MTQGESRGTTTMRAIAIRGPGGPEMLEPCERPRPEPGHGEVRVAVRATAVNRADLLQRMGVYPAPPGVPADIPGLEYAGEVEAVGPGVSELAIGDRVFGLVAGGAYAEAIVTHARAAARIPDGMSFEDAAAVPEAFITAYDAIVTQGGLRGGETLLVHAVGSGVGSAAVQLGRALGAEVIGSARSEDKLDRARGLGLAYPILVAADGRFADAVRKLAPAGAAVVLELVGGAYVEEDLRCVAELGRIVVVGLTAGARCNLDLGLLLRKRARLLGTTLRARPLEEKIATTRVFEREVLPMLRRGTLRPVVDRVLPLAEAARAHEAVGANQTFGKIVLIP
jgi:putative PIG3 family NAD(P)H quinone oxidoreductase